MVKIKYAAFVVACMAAAAASALAQQPTQQAAGALPDGKVAVINTTAFASQIGELKQKYDQVENQFKARYQQLQNLDQQLKTLENDIRTKGPNLAPDKLQEMQENYATMKKRGERDIEDFRSEYDRAIDTATRPVREKLRQFLQNFATQRGIIVLIDLAGAAQTGSLAYIHPSTDITADFVAEYNRANPVAGAAPATQPAATQQRPAAKP